MLKICPCKFNLLLNVLKKKPEDKKHQIESIFVKSYDLHDLMFIYVSKKTKIRYLGVEIKNKDCILNKVLLFFEKYYNLKLHLNITVIKKIPLGSGLGGGSSNAAALINYIISKYNINNLDYEKIALELGSDIPFFLSKKEIAIVKHFGDKISAYNEIKNIKYKIITNDIHSSTREIFNTFDKQKKKLNIKIENVKEILESKTTTNNLMDAAFKVNPLLKDKYDQLIKKDGHFIMSGSGSSFIKIKKIKWS